MKRLRTLILWGTALALVLLPGIASLLESPYFVSVGSRIVIFAIVAVSLDLIVGYGGLVSLGHAAFFGIGAYVVSILAHHAGSAPAGTLLRTLGGELLFVWPVAALTCAAIALVIGVLALRTRGIPFIMISLAFAQMLYFLVVSLSAYGGDEGRRLASRNTMGGAALNDPVIFYFVCLAVLFAVVLLLRSVVNSRFGMVLSGCKQNERRMRALGYRTDLYFLVGTLMANHARFVSPDLLSWLRSGEFLMMVIMGGMGTLFGPVLGAGLLVVLEEVFIGITEHWQALLGFSLMCVVMFARRGLYGLGFGGESAREPGS
jgi:branched-chain amino acid transport system permease protein